MMMGNTRDERMMRLALEAAGQAAQRGEVPVGAVVARDDEVLAVCGNTREQNFDPAGHAEINALREAARKTGDWRLTGCTLYVTLEPCPMCAGALSQARISRVVFGAYDEAGGCCGSVYRIPEDPAFTWYTPCEGGCLRAECEALWQDTFASQRLGKT